MIAAAGRLTSALSALQRPRGTLLAVLRSAAQVFAIRVAGAALAYASMVLLARWLGAYSFGIFAYVLVIVTQLGLIFSFGLNSATLRFVSAYLARRRRGRLRAFLRRSYQLVLGLSIVGALLSAGVLWLARDLVGPYFVPLLVGLLCVPIWSLLNQLEGTARAFGWVNVAYVPGYVVRPLLLIVLVGSVVMLGGAADSVTAVGALVGACGVAAAAQAAVLHARVRDHVKDATPRYHTRRWMTVSLNFLVIDVLRILLDNTDVILVARFLDPHSVAIYFAVIRTAGLVAFVSFAIIALSVPKFAEVHATGTREDLQKLVSNVIQLMFWPSLLCAAVLAVAGPYVLALFGPEFPQGYPTMLIVLAGLVLRTATLPVEYLLNMTGHHRDTLWVYAGAACASVVLNLVLIPWLGIMGAAIASYTAMLGGNAWLYVLVRKRLGVNAFIVPLPRRG